MTSPSETVSTHHPQEWHPSYWEKDTHGSSWEKVKAALQRDWEQTRADFNAGGQELKQDVSDTVKQATGQVPVPADGVANPDPATTPTVWADAEAGVRYGFGARQHYGVGEKWSDTLELKLSREWNEDQTGVPFAAVRPYVRHGWNAKS